MKKNIPIGLGLVSLFIIIVFFFRKNTVIIPIILFIYFIVGLKSKSIRQVFTIIAPILIIWTIHLFDKTNLKSVAIFYLFFIPFITSIGFHLKEKNNLIKILIIFTFIPIGLYIYPNWFQYYENQGAIVNNQSPKIELTTENGLAIRLDTIQNKIIVLDFWNTSCGICFKKFPDLERISKEFKNNPNVVFYCINIPIHGDTLPKSIKMFNEGKFKLVSLYAKDTKISDAFGFNKYPHLVIIKNGKVRYSGALIVEKEIVVYNLKNEINKLIYENSN